MKKFLYGKEHSLAHAEDALFHELADTVCLFQRITGDDELVMRALSRITVSFGLATQDAMVLEKHLVRSIREASQFVKKH